MKSLKLAMIGECMIELQETGPGVTKQTFGGDTLNTAIYCARLAKHLPLDVDYVTALGKDNFSERMIAFWEQEGVGSRLVQRQQGELPGLYYIELDAKGERLFYYWRSASAAKKCFEFPGCEAVLADLAEYDGIYLSGVSLAVLTSASLDRLLGRLSELAGQGLSIYFDCNYRPHLWPARNVALEAYMHLLKISKIAFLTTDEAKILLGQKQDSLIHKELHRLGVEESVVKNGGSPCTISSSGSLISVPAQSVPRVIDTTAAGDSFSAVYLVARCFGCKPAAAAQMAHKTAAYVICHKGAIAPLENMPVTGKDILACAIESPDETRR